MRRRADPKERRRGAPLLLLVALLIAAATPAAAQSYRIRDRLPGERYVHADPLPGRSLWWLAGHVLFGRTGTWPTERVANDPALRLDAALRAGEVAITFVNHATVLVQLRGLNLLTDPVWSERVGPASWAGPERARPPGIPFEELPKIDVVLVSHDHYDHLDLPTLVRLEARDAPLVLVPRGTRDLLVDAGLQRVEELEWWQSLALPGGGRITFTPARHNAGRLPWTVGRSLWGSFVVERDGASVYFAGDTAYAVHFRAIRERLGPVDVALLPIGAYAPRETHRAFHLDPADAVRAQRDLGARHAVAIHYGTFQLTAEDFGQPLIDLERALREAPRGQPGPFHALGEGRTRVFRSDARAPAAVQ